MNTIQDDDAPDLTIPLAARLRAEREERGWSIAELAERSGVSRAMISKVERAEASPTAALLGRLAGALGLTLSTLLARAEGDAGQGGRLARAAAQPVWRDPETGYLRRAVTPPGAQPELVRVELPPGARVSYPAASYRDWSHAIWVLEGELLFHEGSIRHQLAAGDCLVLGPPLDCAFENASGRPCAYLVVLAGR
ncbi:helix-turn-helix domain-containing protein [Roseomonas marmotae]|uniref:Helix-turn-helix transcriptional regulator n=1 Tax=Roseomonas marmotae TaxID=2768161 RepID=A0ABS3KAU1_9PROT|nr:XRE family transcriptional regulator [Roseomonas marmotae]MBO1073476.1 helix-turn-helix transcriptional regulator [Roseomonas marmotae]QTI80331.1 helix-turn-helix transcriptional regulator [Roseomonas marmotae]